MNFPSTQLLAAALTVSLVSQSFAQAPTANPPTAAPARPAPADPKACAPGQRLELDDGTPKAPSTDGRALSDTLAGTDGVLCPPHIDPEIRAPTPPGGTLRVLPPPGSPGGDPSLRPK